MSDKTYPIIALWVHPRSMSTAIERIMRERGDLDCLHEPFMYYYYMGLGKKLLPLSELDIGKPEKFDEIIADMEQRALSGPVFFKDMGYYVLPEIYRYPNLASRLRHLILIRDPRKSILSYFKLDPGVSLEEIGLKAQWDLYEWLIENAETPPFIIEAEAVQKDPIETMTRAWKHIGLPVINSAFQWQADEIPKDWQSVSGWHQSVISSTEIRKVDVDDEYKTRKRFEQVASLNPVLTKYLKYHQPFYDKLKVASVNQ
jgi:hypothetical protein